MKYKVERERGQGSMRVLISSNTNLGNEVALLDTSGQFPFQGVSCQNTHLLFKGSMGYIRYTAKQPESSFSELFFDLPMTSKTTEMDGTLPRLSKFDRNKVVLDTQLLKT